MKLTVLERAIIFNFLPSKGTEQENVLMESIVEKAGFNNEDEVKEKSISFEGGGIRFNPEKDGEGADIKLSIQERSFLLNALKSVDEKGDIPRDVFSLYKSLKTKLNED